MGPGHRCRRARPVAAFDSKREWERRLGAAGGGSSGLFLAAGEGAERRAHRLALRALIGAVAHDRAAQGESTLRARLAGDDDGCVDLLEVRCSSDGGFPSVLAGVPGDRGAERLGWLQLSSRATPDSYRAHHVRGVGVAVWNDVAMPLPVQPLPLNVWRMRRALLRAEEPRWRYC